MRGTPILSRGAFHRKAWLLTYMARLTDGYDILFYDDLRKKANIAWTQFKGEIIKELEACKVSIDSLRQKLANEESKLAALGAFKFSEKKEAKKAIIQISSALAAQENELGKITTANYDRSLVKTEADVRVREYENERNLIPIDPYKLSEKEAFEIISILTSEPMGLDEINEALGRDYGIGTLVMFLDNFHRFDDLTIKQTKVPHKVEYSFTRSGISEWEGEITGYSVETKPSPEVIRLAISEESKSGLRFRVENVQFREQ